jgi:multidrug efflux system outer membrane protein
MRRFVFFLTIGILLSGCSMIPEFKRPFAPIPKEWPKGDAYSSIKYDELPLAMDLRWNEFLIDENLKKIVELALSHNRDLKLSALNVEAFSAYYGIKRAELLPHLDLVGVGQRERTPSDLSQTGRARISSRYSLSIGMSQWEIDLFGRLRSLKEMALEEYLAKEETLRAVRLSLISAVATCYYLYGLDRENLKLAEETLRNREEMYELVKRRYESGISSEIDVLRAKTQLEVAKEAVARYKQILAQDKNNLDLLTGEVVPMELLPEGLKELKPPLDISPGLSSDILLMRPDVMAAEHMLKAYNAQIGAARAAFFPRISLTTLFGTASRELSGLFGSGSKSWSFQPQVIMPIFDARVYEAHRAAKIEREIALANYEKTIQVAFREVSDVLAVKGTVCEQKNATLSLVDSLRKTYGLAKIRYENGIDNYLSVLDVQRSLFQAEEQLNNLVFSEIVNLVNLYKVLGGGWK